MDSRNWAELNSDCLISIFAKVGDTRFLIESLPFVCKSWFLATLDPLCWETISFSLSCSLNAVKFAVDSSQGCATTVMFKSEFPWEALRYLADHCPLLKVLVFEQPLSFSKNTRVSVLLYSVLSKWKNLEKLKLKSCNFLCFLVETIGGDCKKFVDLDCSGTTFEERDIEAIVRCLPQLKSLNVSGSSLNHPQLIAILTTCKDLESLDISRCMGFKRCSLQLKSLNMSRCSLNRPLLIAILTTCKDLQFMDISFCRSFDLDDEICCLASHIKVFNCRGCGVISREEFDPRDVFIRS